MIETMGFLNETEVDSMAPTYLAQSRSKCKCRTKALGLAQGRHRNIEAFEARAEDWSQGPRSHLRV